MVTNILFIAAIAAVVFISERVIAFADRVIVKQDRIISELQARNDVLNESIARQGGHVYLPVNPPTTGIRSPGWYDNKEEKN